MSGWGITGGFLRNCSDAVLARAPVEEVWRRVAVIGRRGKARARRSEGPPGRRKRGIDWRGREAMMTGYAQSDAVEIVGMGRRRKDLETRGESFRRAPRLSLLPLHQNPFRP